MSTNDKEFSDQDEKKKENEIDWMKEIFGADSDDDFEETPKENKQDQEVEENVVVGDEEIEDVFEDLEERTQEDCQQELGEPDKKENEPIRVFEARIDAEIEQEILSKHKDFAREFVKPENSRNKNRMQLWNELIANEKALVDIINAKLEFGDSVALVHSGSWFFDGKVTSEIGTSFSLSSKNSLPFIPNVFVNEFFNQFDENCNSGMRNPFSYKLGEKPNFKNINNIKKSNIDRDEDEEGETFADRTDMDDGMEEDEEELRKSENEYESESDEKRHSKKNDHQTRCHEKIKFYDDEDEECCDGEEERETISSPFQAPRIVNNTTISEKSLSGDTVQLSKNIVDTSSWDKYLRVFYATMSDAISKGMLTKKKSNNPLFATISLYPFRIPPRAKSVLRLGDFNRGDGDFKYGHNRLSKISRVFAFYLKQKLSLLNASLVILCGGSLFDLVLKQLLEFSLNPVYDKMEFIKRQITEPITFGFTKKIKNSATILYSPHPYTLFSSKTPYELDDDRIRQATVDGIQSGNILTSHIVSMTFKIDVNDNRPWKRIPFPTSPFSDIVLDRYWVFRYQGVIDEMINNDNHKRPLTENSEIEERKRWIRQLQIFFDLYDSCMSHQNSILKMQNKSLRAREKFAHKVKSLTENIKKNETLGIDSNDMKTKLDKTQNVLDEIDRRRQRDSLDNREIEKIGFLRENDFVDVSNVMFNVTQTLLPKRKTVKKETLKKNEKTAKAKKIEIEKKELKIKMARVETLKKRRLSKEELLPSIVNSTEKFTLSYVEERIDILENRLKNYEDKVDRLALNSWKFKLDEIKSIRSGDKQMFDNGNEDFSSLEIHEKISDSVLVSKSEFEKFNEKLNHRIIVQKKNDDGKRKIRKIQNDKNSPITKFFVKSEKSDQKQKQTEETRGNSIEIVSSSDGVKNDNNPVVKKKNAFYELLLGAQLKEMEKKKNFYSATATTKT